MTTTAVLFPEVNYIYIPERPMDMQRLTRMTRECRQFLPPEAVLRRVPGVYPMLWPGGGRVDRVGLFGRQLPPRPELQGQGKPWWVVRNLRYGETDFAGRSVIFTNPRLHQLHVDHHQGCTLSHFIVWMDALQRRVQSVVVAESDGYPSRFVGPAGELGDALWALVREAPPDWHLIHLDHGQLGRQPGQGPVRQFRVRGSSGYSLYRWTGEGVAGAALYLASERFLAQVPDMIREFGLEMVDAYLCRRCGEGAAPLRCYTVVWDKGPWPLR